jgi:hypothetical protein
MLQQPFVPPNSGNAPQNQPNQSNVPTQQMADQGNQFQQQ